MFQCQFLVFKGWVRGVGEGEDQRVARTKLFLMHSYSVDFVVVAVVVYVVLVLFYLIITGFDDPQV